MQKMEVRLRCRHVHTAFLQAAIAARLSASPAAQERVADLHRSGCHVHRKKTMIVWWDCAEYRLEDAANLRDRKCDKFALSVEHVILPTFKASNSRHSYPGILCNFQIINNSWN